jgi:hypothetical protein
MDKPALKKLIPIFATVLILLACELPALSLPAVSEPDQAPAPGSLETIVVATAGAAQTQTARVLPTATMTSTSTLVPTSTPTETPTATETIIFDIPTSTKPFVTQSAGSGCQVIAQSPVNNTVFDAREAFTAEWTLRNTGSETWLSTNNDFYHSGGTDMHRTDAYDMPNNVGASGEVTFRVEMFAPRDPGTYTSTWSLGSKKQTLCKVSVTIVVK